MTRDEAEKKARELSKYNPSEMHQLGSYRQGYFEGFLACYDWMMGGEPDGYLYDLENPATAKEDHRLINVWPTKNDDFTKPVKLFEMPLPPPKEEEE